MIGSNVWVKPSELAGLPGLPKTHRGINKLFAGVPADKKRRSKSRGGGFEYHVDAIPETARPTIIIRKANNRKPAGPATEQKPEGTKVQYDREGLWRIFDARPQNEKDAAAKKLEAVQAVEALIAGGAKKDAALLVVAEKFGVTKRTLRTWVKLTRGIEKPDWITVLLPKQKGCPPLAPIDKRFWDLWLSDYLRLEAPAATACWRRLKRKADAEGVVIPSCKTFLRNLDREIDRDVIILKREGEEALARTYPAQERDHSSYRALEAVNADGHKFDVFVKFPDGEICRPVMSVIQCIMSAKILAHRVDKTENSESIRLTCHDVMKNFGIFEQIFLDSGRGFASKTITGHSKTRYRFKIKEDDPWGILPRMGVQVHWCMVRHGQSKPIERAFRDLCESVSKHPRFAGAYTGNNPLSKPENYGSKAIPLDVFLKVLEEEITLHNQQTGRRSRVCNGRSFDDVFFESYQKSEIRKATSAQLRMMLLAVDSVTASKVDGSVTLFGNRYWTEKLVNYSGKKVVARFDPQRLHGEVYIYTLKSEYVCKAECVERAGFGDINAAKEHARNRNRYKKAVKAKAAAKARMTALEVAEQLPGVEPESIPTPKIIKPEIRDSGQIYTKEQRDKWFATGVENLRPSKVVNY